MPVLTDDDVGLGQSRGLSDADVGLGAPEPSETDKASKSLAETKALIRSTREIQRDALARHPDLEANTLGLTEAMQEPVIPADSTTRAASAILQRGFGPAKRGGIQQGLAEFVGENISGLSTPTVAGAIAATPLAPQVMLPIFAKQAFDAIPEHVAQVVEGETPAEKVKGGLGVALDALVAGGAAKGAIKAPFLPLTDAELARLTPSYRTKALANLDANPTEITPPAAVLAKEPWRQAGLSAPTPPPSIEPVTGIEPEGVGPKHALPTAKSVKVKPLPKIGEVVDFEGEGDKAQSGEVIELRTDPDNELTAPIVRTKDGNTLELSGWQTGRVTPRKAAVERVVKESLSVEPPKPEVRVFYDDEVKAYTATVTDEQLGNMHGTGTTQEAAIASLNQHLEAAREHGTWRSVEHPVVKESLSTEPTPKAETEAQIINETETKPGMGEAGNESGSKVPVSPAGVEADQIGNKAFPKAKEPKIPGQGKASQEFDKLIGEHGLQLGWVTNPDAFYAEIGKAGDTASVKGKIEKGKALAAARRNAARDIGVDPSQMDTIAGRANALEPLKKHVAEQSTADTLSEHSSHTVEFLPPEDTAPALELAKPETVAEQAARLSGEAQKKADADKEAKAKGDMLKRVAQPLGGDLGSAGQGSLFPEPGQQEMFKAGSPKPKWSNATDEGALGGQMLAGIPNPIATYKAAVAIGKSAVKALTPAAQRSAEAIRQVAHEVINAGKMTDYRRGVLNWSAKLQRSFGEAADAQADIKRRVPKEVDRQGITNWIQANGDAKVLTDRMNATNDPKLKAGYQAALNLSPEALKVAQEVKGAYNALGLRGEHFDVLKSFKDNYVTQIWNLAKGSTGGGARTLKDRFRFSRASTFPTFFDGEQAGFTPKTKDIAKLLPVYLHEMNSVIASRQLVQELSKGVGSDGRPLVSPRGVGIPINDAGGKATLVMPKVPKGDTGDYKTLPNQPALNDWRWVAKDDAGNPVFLKADLALHPEAYNRIKSVLGRSAIREWYDTPTTALASVPKGIVKGIDLLQSETKRTMLGLFAPFHQVQEGTHAIGHRVNPFSHIPKVDLENDAGQMDATKHGLMMLPDRASEAQFMEGMRPSGIVSKVSGIGPLADMYSNYLFHQYIPGLKYKTYQAILERNQKVYASDLAAGKIKPEEVKALSSSQANAAYGHLNYADLGRNPTIQHLMQLGLLAPDFLEARLRFAGQAIRGATGAKVGREQMIAIATLAVAQATAAWIGAKTTGGEWDAKHPFEFRHGNRRFTMRSVPEDISNAISNTRVFAHSRVSPLVGKGIIQYGSGVDWRGQKVSGLQTTKELVQQPIPLTLRAAVQHLMGTTKPGDISVLEQLAGSAGLKISRANPRQTLNDLHSNWLANNPDPKIKADYERNQAATFPTSKYKTLDTAIADGNTKLAMDAIADLQKTEKDNKIFERFEKQSHGPIFHESANHENAFKKTLTAEQQKLYEAAKKDRTENFKNFQSLWAQRARR